jgi:MFS-type transporter involved in bile tolerance (Atg22 family)
MFGVFFIVLQYLQLQLGFPPLRSAMAILPMAATMLPLAAFSGVWAERQGMRTIITVGLVVGAASFCYLATLPTDATYGRLLPGLLTMGIGVGLAMTPATNVVVSSLPRSQQGVASAVNDTTREVGTALGIAIFGSAFNAGYRHDVATFAEGLPGVLAGPVHDSPATALGAAAGAGPDAQAIVDAARHGFTIGMRWAVLVGAALLLLTAVYTALRAPGLVPDGEPDGEPAGALSDDAVGVGLAADLPA